MTVQTKPLAEITERAIELLARQMGAADTLRFVNQFSTGYGDYTAERDALFGDIELEALLDEIKRTRAAKDASQGTPPAP